MSLWNERLEVARWEFRRYVKPKQLLWSAVITAVMGGVGYGFAELAQRNDRVEVTVAVIGGAGLGIEAPRADGLTIVPHPRTAEDSLRSAVAARELDGLLLVRSPDAAELVVARDRPWHAALESRLTDARQSAALRAAGLTREQLAQLLAPATLQITYESEQGTGGTSRRATLLILFAVLYGIFVAAAYMFTSVTGEKQLRVAEQVLATISPQTWMDGKMIGLTGVAAVSVATIAIGVVLFIGGMSLARGTFELPAPGGDAFATALIATFALLGFAFWLAFLAVVAATVDDPNTSTRGPLLFVPALFTATAFLILGNPDSALARGLALFPPTAPGAMPARIASTDVAAWEIVLAIALLVAGILFLRRAAGRVFAVGMLLYGKEPGWGEVRRWIRES